MKTILKAYWMLAVAVLAVGCYNDQEVPAPEKIYTDVDFVDLEQVEIRDVKQVFLDAFGTLEHTGDNTSWDDTKYLELDSESSGGKETIITLTEKINEELEKENPDQEKIAQLQRSLYIFSNINNYYIKGKVQSNDEEGNVYKSLYICDETGAIEVKLTNGNYLTYPTGHFDPVTETMPSSWVYVKLKGLYLGNYRMMLSIGGAPSSSYNKVGEHKFYANSNLENLTTIAQHVFYGGPAELSVAEGDILVVTPETKDLICCHTGNNMGDNGKALDVMGRLVWIKDVTCRYGVVDENKYPSWMDTNVRPVVSKFWYRWGFNDKTYAKAANLYGSVLFSYDKNLPTYTGKAGVYVVRTSGYARFAAKPIVNDGQKVDILGHLAIYGKYWADYATYQISINRFEDIMIHAEDAAAPYITEAEMNQDVFERTGFYLNGTNAEGEYNVDYDSFFTPSTEDDDSEGSLD